MATGIPYGTIAGADGPHGPDDTPGPPARPGSGWTAGRVITVIIGSVLALISLGLLGGGGTLLWAFRRCAMTGYVTREPPPIRPPGTRWPVSAWIWPAGLLLTGLSGDVRLQVTATTPDRPVFVAIRSR